MPTQDGWSYDLFFDVGPVSAVSASDPQPKVNLELDVDVVWSQDVLQQALRGSIKWADHV